MDLTFISPKDGDMLSDVAGTPRDGALWIDVQIDAPRDCTVTVNGSNAQWNGQYFLATVPLTSYCNALTANCGNDSDTIQVYWLKNAANKYTVSIDDNIWAFADLTKNADKYNSIFDNAFLNIFKQAHDLYGAKVRLNLFYEMDNPCGLDLYGPFNLSMMTDKFKEEFKANAHWLHLAFHAKSEFPDDPYRNATYAQIHQDFTEIYREIIRFAGEECFEWTTTNHFGSGTREAVAAERDLGIRGLMGYLTLTKDGDPYVSYYLSKEQVLHANEYGLWKDHSLGMIFGKIDVVLDTMDIEAAAAFLDEAKAMYPKKGVMQVMTHEQYFYPTYCNYIPDYTQRILTACAWCQENGYTPAFSCEILDIC